MARAELRGHGPDPVQFGEEFGHVVGVGGVLAREPGRVHPGRPAEGVHLSPVSSATAAMPVASHSATALSRALSSSVAPVSSTSGTSGRARRCTARHASPRMAAISAALSGLAVARPTQAVHGQSTRQRGPAAGQDVGLQVEDLGDPVLGQAEQLVELAPW